MKRILAIILALVLCAALTLALVSCDNGNADGDPSENGQGGEIVDNGNTEKPENPEENGGSNTPEGGNGSSPDGNEGDNPDDNNGDHTEGDTSTETVKTPSEGLEYKLSEDGTYYSVVGIGECTDNDLIIPATHESLPVKAIGERAFYNKNFISSVVIPDSVETIGRESFSACYGLVRVLVGNGTKEINSLAFSRCESLTYVTLGENLETVSEDAFYSNSNLYKVVNNSDFELSLGSSNCGNVAKNAIIIVNKDGKKDVKVTDTLGYIEDKDGFLFRIYDGVYTLFAYVGDKSRVTLPTSVDGNPYVMLEVRGVVDIVFSEEISNISDRAFERCHSLRAIEISGSVKKIDYNAFSNCTNLSSVKMACGVEVIGEGAFSFCNSIKSISLPKSVNTLYTGAVSSNATLESIDVDAENECFKSVDGILYSKDGKILIRYPQGKLDTEFNVTNGVEEIADQAFYYCSKLEKISLPDSVKSVGYKAFAYCLALVDIDLGDGVEFIDDGVFSSCSSLSSIELPNSIKYVGVGAFFSSYAISYNKYDNANYLGNSENPYLVLVSAKDQNISSCAINPSTKVIAENAFENCGYIRNITIPDSVIAIGSDAFYYCKMLKSVVIGKGVEVISAAAFEFCEALEAAVIGDNIKSIERSAFGYCKNLTTVVLGEGVEKIDSWAFINCENIKEVYYNGSAESFANVDIDKYNPLIDGVNVYYYSETEPNESGSFWHYDENGKPVAWN